MNENGIRIKAPAPKRSSAPVDWVQVGDYSYHPHDSIGLGYISNVYLGKHVPTSKSEPRQTGLWPSR
jgi:hypothetical protein